MRVVRPREERGEFNVNETNFVFNYDKTEKGFKN